MTIRLTDIRTWLLLLSLALNGCASVHWGLEHDYLAAGLSAETEATTGPGDIHVITWNLHGPPNVAPMDARLARVSNELLARHPDLILLQEIWFEGDMRLLKSALQSKYELVPNHPSVRDGFLSAIAGFRNGGLVAFLRSDSAWKRVRKDAETSTFQAYKVAAPASRISEGDGRSNKGFQRFDLEKKGVRVTIFNTHLQSQYGDGRRYVAIREEQINELAAAASAQLSDAVHPVTQLAFGDFNTSPSEWNVYGEITKSWIDLTSQKRAHCHCGTSLDVDEDPKSYQMRTVEVEWIDYALAKRGTDVQTISVTRILSDKIDVPFSDHHGLEVVLALPH